MRILHNSFPFEIFLQKLPLSICGLTLGLGALGNLLLAYSKMFHWIYISMAAILWLPFYPSYGALTFPFVIPAVALEKLLHTLNAAGAQQLFVWNIIVRIEESIAIVMVTYALLRYLYFLWGIAQSTRKETARPPSL